jgi:hypothetical protein
VSLAGFHSTRYVLTDPLTRFQFRVGLVDSSIAPAEGLTRPGVDGAGGTVVNDRVELQLLLPPEFSARTRQSYVVPWLKPSLTVVDVPVEISEALLHVSLAGFHSTRYVLTGPPTTFQFRVGLVDSSIAPAEGLTRPGVDGAGGTVVNDHVELQLPVPPAFSARTRQLYVAARLSPESA